MDGDSGVDADSGRNADSGLDADSARDSRCRCGHPHSAHLHYRGGTECALCLDCPRYRPADGLLSADGLLRQLTAFLRRRPRS